MNQPIKRHRGAQSGNQNARKHGFYSKVLDLPQKHDLQEASLVTGLDQEITVIRVKLKSILEREPDNIRLLTQLTAALTRLMRTRKALGLDQQDDLGKAIHNLIVDIGLPLLTEASRAALIDSKGIISGPTQTDRD